MNGTTRDIGLKSPGAGKGDAPRNVSAKFFQNYDGIFWLVKPPEDQCGFVRRGNKLRKVYR